MSNSTRQSGQGQADGGSNGSGTGGPFGGDADGQASTSSATAAGDDASTTSSSSGGPDEGGVSAGDGAPPGSAGDGSASGDAGGSGIERWHPTVLSFTSTGSYTNAYLQNSMTAVFTGPGGAMLRIPGYYTGSATWAVRFSPTAVGAWTYATQSADAGLNGHHGTITCVPNTNPNVHGGLRIDAAHPTHILYEDGTPYFPLAYESDWLGLMDLTPTDTPAGHAKTLIDMQSANGFHEVLMNVFAYDTNWGADAMYDFGPTKAYPWGGTNQAPQHGQINPAFFDRFDAVIDYLFQKGVTAHLMFMVFNKMVNWPTPKSAEDDKYFEYVTARYQAYPNMIWDFAKETFNAYKYASEAYVGDRLALIKSNDAYQRLRTAHAPINGGATPAGANYWFDVTPNNLDLYTAEAVRGPGCYANTRQSMMKVGAFPYANDESSYQIGNDGTSTYSASTQSATDVHDYVMENIMAGAGAAYYYAYHAWDDVRYNEVPAKIGFFKNMSDVFTNHVMWNEIAPNDGLIGGGGLGKHCLANPGKEYVIELSPAAQTTSVSVTVAQLAAGATLAATWYDLDAGGSMAATPVTSNGTVTFTKPFTGVGLLHLK